MNRYEHEGVLTDLRDSFRVLYLTDTKAEADCAMDMFGADLAREASRVVRANGKRRIDLLNGGIFVARSFRTGARGMSFDIVIATRRAVDAMGDLASSIFPLLDASRAPQAKQFVIQGA